MKYLIAGLGNIGDEYKNTRHNIGFNVLDALAEASNLVFTPKRYADKTEFKYKGRNFILIKPSTYVNLSGKAVNYWLQKEKIPLERMLVILDDIALPFGLFRIRPKGSDGGHNGLKNINQVLGTQNYPRMRIGIGDEFYSGQQVDYVLGEWSAGEKKELDQIYKRAAEAIKSFGTIGVERTMNLFNQKTKKRD